MNKYTAARKWAKSDCWKKWKKRKKTPGFDMKRPCLQPGAVPCRVLVFRRTSWSCRCWTWPPSCASPTPSRPSCCASTSSTWPSTTRTTTSATAPASCARWCCPGRTAASSPSTPRRSSWRPSPPLSWRPSSKVGGSVAATAWVLRHQVSPFTSRYLQTVCIAMGSFFPLREMGVGISIFGEEGRGDDPFGEKKVCVWGGNLSLKVQHHCSNV